MGRKKVKESILPEEKVEKIDMENVHGRHKHQTKKSKEERESKSEHKRRKERKERKEKIIKWSIRLAVAAAIILILTALGFIVFSKVIITIDDELTLQVSPLQQSVDILNGESTEIRLSLRNDNFWQCDALCVFRLVDLENSTEVYSETEVLSHNQEVEKSFEVKVPARGSGQVLYSFQAECNNIKSVICLTDEKKRFSQAIAAVNYDLSGEDQATKTDLKPKLEALLTEAGQAEESLAAVEGLAYYLPEGPSESSVITAAIQAEKGNVEVLAAKAEKLRQAWSVEDYESLRKLYKEEDAESVAESTETLSSLEDDIRQLADTRNTNLDLLIGIEDIKDPLESGYLSMKGTLVGLGLEENISFACEEIHNQFLLMTREVPHSEEKSSEKISSSVEALRSAVAVFKRAQAETELHTIILREALLLKNESLAEMNSTSDCTALKGLLEAAESSNANATASQEDNFGSENNSVTHADIRQAEDYLASESLKNAVLETEAGTSENKRLMLSLAQEMEANYTGPDPDKEALALALIETGPVTDTLTDNCRDGSASEALANLHLERVLETDFSSLESLRIALPRKNESTSEEEEVDLSSNPGRCCVLGACTACCEEGECADEYYPVLLIHGHAFNKNTHPNSALTVFSGMEQKMESDGFIPLGQLELAGNPEDEIPGVWGRARKSAVMKASYYFITYYGLGDYSVGIKKEESIENYAIRLKEIIDMVKEKTGKSKVRLVAHSMGGLVAREYITLFGGESVDRLITVNTPHQGVSGRVEGWCTLFGSHKECDDLSAGSIFLSRLNSKGLPAGVKAFAIRSVGCPMDNGKIGDGIVTEDSAYWSEAENYLINGTCTDTLKSDLHMDALDPKLHPDVYRLVLKLLKE